MHKPWQQPRASQRSMVPTRVSRRSLGFGFALIVLATVWSFPYFGAMKSAAEMPRVILADQLATAHTVTLDARLAEFGSRFDIATTSAELGRHHYSNKAPGVSFLGAPVAVVVAAAGGGSMALTFWLRLVAVTLPCLLFLWWFYPTLRDVAGDEASARLIWVALALGSLMLPYQKLFFSHGLSAAALAGMFVMVQKAQRTRAWIIAGSFAGAAVIIDYQCVFGVLIIGGYAWYRVRAWRALAWIAAGGAPFAVLLGWYHTVCFGVPWRTGYHFAVDPAHKQGVLGMVGPSSEAIWQTLLAPNNGLLALSPWVLLGVVGFWAVWRLPESVPAPRAELFVAALVSLVYVGFVASLLPSFGRAGWSVGPRYLGCALPFMALLAGRGVAVVSQSRPWLPPMLVTFSIVVYVLAANTFPHWPDGFQNPLWEVSVRALAEGRAPHSVGSWIGLAPRWGLVPAFVAAAAALIWAVPKTRAGALGVVLGVLAVLLTKGLPSTPAAEAERMTNYVKLIWEP